MSDFKTNEYANLLGEQFEPKEENPMLGWRRYYDERYRDAYALECQALLRVRSEMGLTNVIAMIPFCRTPDEGRRLAEMAKHGLSGARTAVVYVNVMFSIGNDLTQLTLS